MKTYSNVFNTSYYLLASTRHAKEGSFIYETSNLSGWTKHAQKEWDVKAHFETYSQGKEVHDQVAKVASSKRPTSDRMPADDVKKELRGALNDLLGVLPLAILLSGLLS